VATGPDHYRRAEELLARDGPLTGEVLATAQVHATLALAAATALAGVGRIEADAWHEVAGTRFADLPPVPAAESWRAGDRPAATAKQPVR
jgi:hypothetical protein